MSRLQVLQPWRSFVQTLFLFLLVSLWTRSVSAWIQQQHIVSDRKSQSSFCDSRCRHYHEVRVHRQEFEDEQSTPNTVGKTLNTIPERQGGMSSAHRIPSRRNILSDFFVFSSTISTATTANAATTTSGNTVDMDPFAAMDSIASGFGSSGPSPPTKDSTPQVPTIAATKPYPAPSTNNGNLSALEKALEESRKRKQIDPRTHG